MNLQELAENLGLEKEEYIEMIELFFESGGADLQKLEAAVADGNAERGHAVSHSLKGSTGSLGLTEIYEQTRTIDDKLRGGDFEGVADMVANLRRLYDALAAATGKAR